MKRLALCICLLLSPALLSGCDEIAGIGSRIGSFFRRSVPTDPVKMTEDASAEVDKLFAFEYRVVPLSGTDSRAVENALNQLGHDHWECFQIMELQDGVSAVCKRAPKSYLRYFEPLVH